MERLTKRVEELTEQIALYEFQISTQSQETQAARQVLAEVRLLTSTCWRSPLFSGSRPQGLVPGPHVPRVPQARMEVDSLEVERKQLLQQWNRSLVGMQRRDEAHAAKQGELR